MGINDPDNKAFSYSKNQRWYDKYPNIKKAFDDLKYMPSTTQTLFGQVVMQFYEFQQQKKLTDRQNLSVGADKALALWKTREKRRAEDKVALLYKAMMTVYLMEDPLRSTLAFRIADGLNALSLYGRLCKKKYRAEDDEDRKELFKTAAESGEEAARDYLLSIGFTQEEIDELDKLDSDKRTATVPAPAPDDGEEDVPEWLKSDWGKLANTETVPEETALTKDFDMKAFEIEDFDIDFFDSSTEPLTTEKLASDRIKLEKQDHDEGTIK
jgi:hypothetical protein